MILKGSCSGWGALEWGGEEVWIVCLVPEDRETTL